MSHEDDEDEDEREIWLRSNDTCREWAFAATDPRGVPTDENTRPGRRGTPPAAPPGIAGRLFHAPVFADLLLVHADAEQGQGGIQGRPAAAAARRRPSAATAARD